MTTKQNMIDEIESDTERSDTTAIGAKIDAAIRHYQPKRFWFNESRSVTFSTVAGTDEYSFATIGTEFYKIDAALLTNGSSIVELDRVDYLDIEPGQTPTGQGVPSAYAYIAKAARLSPSPNAIYAIRLTGHIKLVAPQTLVEDDNAWMNEAYSLIMARAKAELYAHRWEDANSAAIMRAAESEYLRVLLGETQDKVALGYLESTDF